jgi:hypothetical protein
LGAKSIFSVSNGPSRTPGTVTGVAERKNRFGAKSLARRLTSSDDGARWCVSRKTKKNPTKQRGFFLSHKAPKRIPLQLGSQTELLIFCVYFLTLIFKSQPNVVMIVYCFDRSCNPLTSVFIHSLSPGARCSALCTTSCIPQTKKGPRMKGL